MNAVPSRGWQFRGLAFRVGTLVFAASLFASLVIAWLSLHSIESFLRSRIDRKFPELLANAQERLDLWYRQRELDAEVFARNPVLAESLERDDARSREEAQRFLAYVLESSPQFSGLTVMDAAGRKRVAVGDPFPVPAEIASQAGGEKRTRVSPLIASDAGPLQLVSAPLPGRRPQALYARLRLDGLGAALAAADLGDASLALFDAAGTSILGDGLLSSANLAELTAPAEPALLEQEDGTRVIASASEVPRFGWKLVVAEPYALAFAPVAVLVRRVALLNVLVVLLSSGMAYALGVWRLRPIIDLVKGARRLAGGEEAVRVPVTHARDEVAILAHAFNEMAARLDESRLELQARNQDLVRTNEVLEQLSITDGLTKLHNHRHFQDQFNREARRAERNGSSLALVLLDIDDFKKLNDQLGHSAGDRVLERVAQIMNEQIRETDYLARYGGEEFALLLPGTDGAGAVALAEKMRLATSRQEISVVGAAKQVRVTLSCGVAVYRSSTGETFDAADRALYEAKAAGKDCVALANG